MEGVTHPLFRKLIAEQGGVGLVCTEFLRVTAQPMRAARLCRRVVKVAGTPLSVQIMGRDPKSMAETAAMVCDLGADVVDINMGCPSRNATKGGVGAAMLKDPALVHRVVTAVRARTPVPLSVKLRAGFNDASNAVQLAKVVQDGGADLVTVHPRRRVDFYHGVADWRMIKRVKAALAIPVIGNGDCWYAADAPRMQEETGCDGVMIGRPAVRNPWIFVQIDALRRGAAPANPSGADLVAYLVDTASRYTDAYGAALAFGKLKELVRYLGRAVNDGTRFGHQALRSQSMAKLLEVADRRLAGMPAEALDLDAWGRHRLETSGSATHDDDSPSGLGKRETGPSEAPARYFRTSPRLRISASTLASRPRKAR